ncbi:hypothetical protein CE91St36_05230 [Christensenellaceae bacterium]|nr:hypothetical protein CE91St36_05230 [Christensenellaceae bacterium]BDF60374.1 hypothetical protein CE91St37_05240 [Christensenellaceae bacterium]
MDKQIKERLLQSKKAAAEEAAAILAEKELSERALEMHLKRYLQCKFMLEEQECVSDCIDELSKASIAKSLRLSKELLKEVDIATSCEGATSATIKKVLFFMAVQRELGIRLPADGIAGVETIGDLAKLVFPALKG